MSLDTPTDRSPMGNDAAHDHVIEVTGLTKLYPPDVLAVDSLDLQVRRGEIFGLLGPNGAGKSTTAGMLTTRVIPTAGTVFVGGIDVVAHPTHAKRIIGVVPQTNTLDRSLTAAENLSYHGQFFGMSAKQAKREAAYWIDRIKLNRFADKPVLALSGGMAQRLMLARAVMHRPDVLFLDEPTTGLDPQSRLALYEMVRELNADGQTILLTTHYMEEADELCERIAIIDHGKVLALDTPDGFKRQIGADTIVTLDARGDLEGFVDALEAIDGVRSASRNGDVIRLAIAGTDGIVAPIVMTADRSSIELVNISVTEPSLETVFIHLTGKELRD